MSEQAHLSDILTHLGEDRERYFQAVSPPIIQSSNFVFKDLEAFRNAFSSEMDNHLYTRGNNPTVEILRKKVAALEGTEDALIFGSGSAAVAAAVLSQVRVGDHVVCIESPYSWTRFLLTEYLPRFGVTADYIDGSDLAALEEAIRPNTSVLFLESPTSMTFSLQDLGACAQLAKKHDLATVIDNSCASPLFQQPAAFGIDLIVHSGTKYLNGHSDVVMGVVCGSKEKIAAIFAQEYMCIGAIIGPQEAALAIRGLRTLQIRMDRINTNGLKIAQWLEQHPKIEKVIHPFLSSHPQHELAKRQMKGQGGLFAFYLKSDDRVAIEAFVHRLERFLMAVSWGGHESLIIPGIGFYDIPGKPTPSLPMNLCRLYVGLEDPAWLIEDLAQALDVL